MTVGTNAINVTAGTYLVAFSGAVNGAVTLAIAQNGVAVDGQTLDCDTFVARTAILNFTDAGTISLLNAGQADATLTNSSFVVVKLA